MATDFMIDDRGDFILSVPTLYPRLKLSWVNSNYPVLKISFEQIQEYKNISKNKRLRLDFITDQDSRPLNQKFVVVNDKDELRQRIAV